MCPGSRQFAPAPLFTQLVLCTLLDRELPVAAGLRPVCTKTSPDSLGQWFLLLSLPPSILLLQPHLIGAVRTPAGEPVDSAFGFSGSEQGPQDAREQPADSLRTMSLKGQAGTSQTSHSAQSPAWPRLVSLKSQEVSFLSGPFIPESGLLWSPKVTSRALSRCPWIWKGPCQTGR